MKTRLLTAFCVAALCGCGAIEPGQFDDGVRFFVSPLSPMDIGYLREVEITVDHPKRELLYGVNMWLYSDLDGDGAIDTHKEVGHHQADLEDGTAAYRTGSMLIPRETDRLRVRFVVELRDNAGQSRQVEHEWDLVRGE